MESPRYEIYLLRQELEKLKREREESEKREAQAAREDHVRRHERGTSKASESAVSDLGDIKKRNLSQAEKDQLRQDIAKALLEHENGAFAGRESIAKKL